MAFSLPSATNATVRLSGDQNRATAPSVPGSGCASSASSERTHSRRVPARTATNARRRPSGESANSSFGVTTVFGGAVRTNRTAFASLARVPRTYQAPRAPMATAMPIAASAQATRVGHRRTGDGDGAVGDVRRRRQCLLDVEPRVADISQPPRRILLEASPQQPSNARRASSSGAPASLARLGGRRRWCPRACRRGTPAARSTFRKGRSRRPRHPPACPPDARAPAPGLM